MPIVNIIDRRKRKYRFLKVNAVVEAAWHDNTCQDSDQVEYKSRLDGPDYREKEHITLEEAVLWGNSFSEKVTLFVYDEDRGIYATVVKRKWKAKKKSVVTPHQTQT